MTERSLKSISILFARSETVAAGVSAAHQRICAKIFRLGSARVSRVGFGVSPKRTFGLGSTRASRVTPVRLGLSVPSPRRPSLLPLVRQTAGLAAAAVARETAD